MTEAVELSLSSDFLEWLVVEARMFEQSDDAPIDEEGGGGAVGAELAEAIDGLNERQQTELVALVWTGRDLEEGRAPEPFLDLLAMARGERVNRTSAYLLGMPLLPDYLAEGAGHLGFALDV